MVGRRREIIDQPFNTNVIDTRELISEEDEGLLSEIRGYRDDLDQMIQSFEDAISELDRSTATMDSEIKSFDILDDFFNDPSGLANIDLYLQTLYETNEGETPLNAVTSSIALSAIGILETLKKIKGENPDFVIGASNVDSYIEDITAENAGLQTEKLKAEAEVSLSDETKEVSFVAEEKHGMLKRKLSEFHANEILRNGHVKRALDSCLSTGIYDTINLSGRLEDKEAAVRNLMEFTLACLSEQPH